MCLLLNGVSGRRLFMSYVNLGLSQGGSIQPEGAIKKPEEEVEAKPIAVTSAVVKGGKEEPKGLGERISAKLKEIFGSKSESTDQTPSLKFSQKIIRMLVPGSKKEVSARTNKVGEQNLKQNPDNFKELSDTLTTKSTIEPGDLPPSDLPPALPPEVNSSVVEDNSFPTDLPPALPEAEVNSSEVVDNSFPTDLPPALPEAEVNSSEVVDNSFPTDLPPALPPEAEVNSSEVEDNSFPKDLPPAFPAADTETPPSSGEVPIATREQTQQAAVRPRPGEKRVLDLKTQEAHKAYAAKMNNKLGMLLDEFPEGEKKASKLMGQVPNLIDIMMSDSIDKPVLQSMPRLTKRLEVYKENYKNAEEAANKFGKGLEAIIKNKTLDPLAKSAELGKFYTREFQDYANLLSPCISNYKEFLEDTQGFGARTVENEPDAGKVSQRLNAAGNGPTQRLMRHGLLLVEVVKTMPKDDPRRADLQKVLDEVNRITTEINLRQKVT